MVAGDCSRLQVPSRTLAARVDGLWKHTCFEAFVACQDSAGYREYNFSPSQQWAAYAFRAYREPIELNEVEAPLIEARQERQHFVLTACIRLDDSLTRQPFQLGLSAVLEDTDGALSYWALQHPAAKPDFHHRDSFVLLIDTRTSVTEGKDAR